MNNRVLVAGLIGGIAFFFLGYLMYALLLAEPLAANTMSGAGRPDDDIQFVYLVIGNLAFGFLFAYILDKPNVRTAGSGGTMGLIIGLLTGIGVDMAMYGTTYYYTSLTGVLYDVIAITVMSAIVGALLGWWYGRGHKAI